MRPEDLTCMPKVPTRGYRPLICPKSNVLLTESSPLEGDPARLSADAKLRRPLLREHPPIRGASRQRVHALPGLEMQLAHNGA